MINDFWNEVRLHGIIEYLRKNDYERTKEPAEYILAIMQGEAQPPMTASREYGISQEELYWR